MVGEEEFYLRVGGILQTKSAFVGHITHDPAKEHIDAKDIRHEEVPQYSESYDRSFTLNLGDLMTVVDTLKDLFKQEAIDEGIPQKKAEEIAEENLKTLKNVSQIVDDANATLQNIDESTQTAVQEKVIEVPSNAPVSVKRRVARQNLDVLSSSVRKAAQQKVRVLDQQIAAIEDQKARSPDLKETAITLLDSALDGLKSLKNGCQYIIHNPLEAIEWVYNVTAMLGEKAVDKTTNVAKFAWNHPAEAWDSTSAKISSIYDSVRNDIWGTSLDVAEYAPLGIGVTVEGVRDFHGIYIAKDRDLRSVADKWRDYGLICAIGGKAAKQVTGLVLKNISTVTKKGASRLGKTSIKQECTTFRGGAYDSIKVTNRPHNIERHHIPADSVSGVSKGKGMAIQMDAEDHAKTSSFRNSSSARKYRQTIKEKIESGDTRGAIATEIWDVKRTSGRKYNKAMQEMLIYGKNNGLVPKKK